MPPHNQRKNQSHGRIAGCSIPSALRERVGEHLAVLPMAFFHRKPWKLPMFDIHREEIDWGGRRLVLETGRLARQADGAVLATYGDTTVIATVVAAKEPKVGIDFLPLTVNYQEKYFAAGRIPGGYFKREGRPTEKETLTSRLIDRPLRPLFPQGYFYDTQIISILLSADGENDPDILAINGASAALCVSDIPF